jgi:hypothetical protein
MTKLASVIFVHLLSLTAIWRLYLSLPSSEHDRIIWQFGAPLISLLLTLVIAWEIYNYWRTVPSRFRIFKNWRIKRYMRRWLSSGGRAVIFTRDMSWADDKATRDVLSDKARAGELIICIEHTIPLAEELATKGATIISYGELGVVPRSRYTIVDFESDSARVAVGGAVGYSHVIQVYRNGQHPFFSVAEDLAKILLAYKRVSNAARG